MYRNVFVVVKTQSVLRSIVSVSDQDGLVIRNAIVRSVRMYRVMKIIGIES